jgi:hypothetical protein
MTEGSRALLTINLNKRGELGMTETTKQIRGTHVCGVGISPYNRRKGKACKSGAVWCCCKMLRVGVSHCHSRRD